MMRLDTYIADEWLKRLRNENRRAGFYVQLALLPVVVLVSWLARRSVLSEPGFYLVVGFWLVSVIAVKVLTDRRRGSHVRPVLYLAAWSRGLVLIGGVVLSGGSRSPLLLTLPAAVFSFAMLGMSLRDYLRSVACLWLALLVGLWLAKPDRVFTMAQSWTVAAVYWLPVLSGAAVDRYLGAVSSLALRDAVTGVMNHRYFQEALQTLGAQALRSHRSLSLLMIDIDDFKRYNDRNGHPAGDRLLRELGTLLACGCRATDVVARYGGEEFSLLFPDTPAAQALSAADRLRKAVAATRFEYGPVTVPVGVAALLEHVSDPDQLVRAADDALYDAKRSGKNRVGMPEAIAL